MKKRLMGFMLVFVFIAGLSLVLYPYVADAWNTYRRNTLVKDYEEKIETLKEEGKVDYSEEWEKARKYNEKVVPFDTSTNLPDPFALVSLQKEPSKEYMDCLNIIGDGVMGYVEIPKIDVLLPIYHTDKEEVLQNAAGHMEGSSFPIGGESTHAIVVAHRGLPNVKLFSDLDELKEGDHFLIGVLNEVLCYEVDQIKVVEPGDIKDLSVVNGEDYVTLLTCTPYGVNSHRLLVRGHRVEYNKDVLKE